MRHIEINAPAKINLGLSIINKREDGFHNIHTLFFPILDLYDKIILENSDRFKFECNDSSLPTDKNNLVVKAVNILEEEIGRKINVDINLIKKIPSQAGLGGGSSDAAATLLSLNEMFQLNFSYDQLMKISLKIGSDVPFFILNKPAIGKSRGEVLEKIDLLIREPILIINPNINISTKEAFNNIIPTEKYIDYKACISSGNPNYTLMRNTVKNDFESYVFNKYPEIGDLKEQLYKFGALFALMSGSGSTVYGIFKTFTEAQLALHSIPKKYSCWLSNLDY